MNLSSIARKNIKGNMYRYIMYALSNAFSVAVFFIFFNYSNHPVLLKGMVGARGAMISSGLTASRVIIVIFSILFVNYSTKVFLNSRGQEFGLLSLYGMTKKQLRKFLMKENTFLSFMSTVIGLVAGIVFSKVFFMIMGKFLGIDFYFYVSMKALVGTFITFFILFEVMSLYSMSSIKNKEILSQLNIDREVEDLPKFSVAKAFLGIILLGIGYAIAALSPMQFIPLMLIPVTLIVVAGTYFFLTEFSIFFTIKVLKRESILFKKKNFIPFSHMVYKLKDNTKVLFLVSILGAVTLTAMGTMYSFYTEMPRMMGLNTYSETSFMVENEKDLGETREFENLLEKNQVKIKENIDFDGYIYEMDESGDIKGLILSNSQYNQMAEKLKGPRMNLKEGEILLNGDSNMEYNEPRMAIPKSDFYRSSAGEVYEINGREYKSIASVEGSMVSSRKLGYVDTFILNDEDFKREGENLKEVSFKGYRFEDKDLALKVTGDFEKRYEGAEGTTSYFSTLEHIDDMQKANGIMIFVGFFTASLFFIAAGSILYFKLFSEVKKDRVEYSIIAKVGTTEREINKMATREIRILFFLPFVIASIHSLFAMAMLSNLVSASVLKNGIVVILGYLGFQIIFFTFLRKMYLKKLR